MKDQTCCFMGHRAIFPEEYARLRQSTKQAVLTLIEQGVYCFVAGGAKGFDTLAAEVVLECRKDYPQLQLELILPCGDQTRGWSTEDQMRYNHIRCCADKVFVLSPHYYRGCMQERNRRMVDRSAYCVAYCHRETGGTAYTVAYAQRQQVTILYV